MARMRSWTVASDGAGGEGIEWRRANGDWVLAITHRNRQGWRVRTFQDISQMKRIEAATAETARLLQLTLDSMGQGLTMYDGIGTWWCATTAIASISTCRPTILEDGDLR